MAATTLTTFRPRLSPSIRSVDLWGSWDNFQEAYPLQKDRLAGPGHWRGCHSFKNVVCDGHDLDVSKRRDGGLKMGGIYWYFYRLDGDLEQHDANQPSTTVCPLLPGQEVNVLNVPIQQDAGHRSNTLLESTVFTLDPKAKYNPLRPHNFMQASHHRKHTAEVSPTTGVRASLPLYLATCSTASATDLEPLKRTGRAESQGPCISFPRGSALIAIFHRMRGARSAPSSTKAPESERPTSPRPRWETEPGNVPIHDSTPELRRSRVKAPVNTPEWPLAPRSPVQFAPWDVESSPYEYTTSGTSSRVSSRQYSHTRSRLTSPAQSYNACQNSNCPASAYSQRTSTRSTSDAQGNQTHDGPEPTTDPPFTTKDSTTAEIEDEALTQLTLSTPQIKEDCLTAIRRAASPLILPIQSNTSPPPPSKYPSTTPSAGMQRPTRPPSLLYSNRETLQTFYATSSSYGGGQPSPCYLSQPETPSVRDYEELLRSENQTRPGSEELSYQNPSTPLVSDDDERRVETSALDHRLQLPQLPSPGFQDYYYSLPAEDHVSTLTLRKPASAGFAPDDQAGNGHLVQAWNDGSEHHHHLGMSTLDALVDDLGYLGPAIV